jgi:hypothetical protein
MWGEGEVRYSLDVASAGLSERRGSDSTALAAFLCSALEAGAGRARGQPMAEFLVSGVRFEGLGATAGSAVDASRLLAERLNHWCADHPTFRILDLQIQSTAIGADLHLTAVFAYIDAAVPRELLEQAMAPATATAADPADESTAVALAEEIVAEARHEG